MHSWIVGFGLGFFVALQLGPMSLFLIRCTLRGSWRIGLAIGGGIATIDCLYAACGLAGAAPLLTIEPLRVALGLTWVTLLAIIVTIARRGLGPRAVRLADSLAGLGMLGFGGALAYHTMHER